MNELLEKTDAGATAGSPPVKPASPSLPQKPVGIPAAGNAQQPSLPPVAIGKPGYQFKFDANTPAGQEERREHERIRKSDKRAAFKANNPAPLPAPPVVDTLQAPPGEQVAGTGNPTDAVPVETFVPWVGADVADFTDELVELAETKRIVDFVNMAKDANMPGKFIAEIEKKAAYPVKSKASLKRCLADCAAKWLNKSGVSSTNKEEVKVLFCMVTIKLQGVRLKRDFAAIIAADVEARKKIEAKNTTPAAPATLAKQ